MPFGWPAASLDTASGRLVLAAIENDASDGHHKHTAEVDGGCLRTCAGPIGLLGVAGEPRRTRSPPLTAEGATTIPSAVARSSGETMRTTDLDLEIKNERPTEAAGPLLSSAIVAALEATWAAIHSEHPEVPAVVIVLASGSIGVPRGTLRLGHFAAMRWHQSGAETRLPEVFVGGEGLARGAVDVLGTLLHEATHALAHVRGVQECSRQGRYHNRRFQALAAEMGLRVEQVPVIGWSETHVMAEPWTRTPARSPSSPRPWSSTATPKAPWPPPRAVSAGATRAKGPPTASNLRPGRRTHAAAHAGEGSPSLRPSCPSDPSPAVSVARNSFQPRDQAKRIGPVDRAMSTAALRRQ